MRFYLGVLGVLTALLVGSASARAQVTYSVDDGTAFERFNNSFADDTEDNWVANSFQVVAGGTHLTEISLAIGEDYTNQLITFAIYSGSDLFDPSAGGGLVRVSTTDVTFTGAGGFIYTFALTNPVDLNVGDIFYAAALIRAVPPTMFPIFNNNSPSILNRSFFDVGPTVGAPYDLDNTANATVNGGVHPVVGGGPPDFDVQDPGNTILRVNATGG